MAGSTQDPALERVKISELPDATSYINLYTIGTDGYLRSVRVPLEILSKIGDPGDLRTTDKSSLVAAINEAASSGGVKNVKVNGVSVVDGDGVAIVVIPIISTNIASDAASNDKTASPKAVKIYVDGVTGDLSALETVDKTSLVAAINEAARSGSGSNLTGYVIVDSVASLPVPGQPTLGYLVGEDLYLYVGAGGDTRDGAYKDCGPFRGPRGIQGLPGPEGPLPFTQVEVEIEDNTPGNPSADSVITGDTLAITFHHIAPELPDNLVYIGPEEAPVPVPPIVYEEVQNKVSVLSEQSNNTQYPTAKCVHDALATKQPTLVSGENIKTINNQSILGSGNISIQGGGSDPNAVKFTEQSLTSEQQAQARTNIGAGTYSKPNTGIPKNDLASGVKDSLDKADAALLTLESRLSSLPSTFSNKTATQAASALGINDVEFQGLFVGEYGTILFGQPTLIGGSGDVVSILSTSSSEVLMYGGGKYLTLTWADSKASLTVLTKNPKDAYTKPSGGIPKTDLASAVQTLLEKADTAVQPEEGKGLFSGSYNDLSNKPAYAGSTSAGGPANKTLQLLYGEMDSSSTGTAFVATVEDFPTTLYDGLAVMLYNNVIGASGAFTLNVNNTGALPVYLSTSNTGRIYSAYGKGRKDIFVYNSTKVAGGCWDLFVGYYANDTAGLVRANNATTPVSDNTYRYRLLFQSAAGDTLVPANTSTSTGATTAKTVNQRAIDPFGLIQYNSQTASVTAGGTISATSLYTQYNLTLGYSFNVAGGALSLTANSPVYLKCAPQADGSAIMDDTTPIVQSLPSTADGKIYIFLGIASSATQVELKLNHPVYYHDGAGIKIWTGASIPTVPVISTSVTDDATSDTKTSSPKSVKTYVDGICGDIQTLLSAI